MPIHIFPRLSLYAHPRNSLLEGGEIEVLSVQQSDRPTIVVLDGGGYSAGAEVWLKGQSGKGKLLHVFNLGKISRFQS